MPLDGFAPQYDTLGDLVCDLAEQMLRPPERLSVSESAAKYRYLNNPGSYIGMWKNEKTPYLVEPMNELNSRDKKAVVLAAPAQSGKTDCILCWLLYSVVCDPADLILYQTSNTAARDFSIRRVDRLHRHSKIFREYLGPKNDTNVHDVKYRNGVLFTLSWPSINEMSGKPVPRVALTDYDRMDMNVGGEGSPFDLGSKRTTTFKSFGKTFVESSPGKPVTDIKWIQKSPHQAPPCEGILALYNRGDRRRWHWPCPHCNEYFEPSFARLSWDSKLKDPLEAGETVVMVCPTSGCIIEPDNKARMNRAGVWVPEGMRVDTKGKLQGKGVRSEMASFWLKGPAAEFVSWKDLVVKYLNAEREFQETGSQEALKTTVNTDQGEPFYPRGSEIERLPEDLKTKAIVWKHKLVPAGVRFLLAHVDTQKNKWVVQVHGIGKGGDIWVVDRFDIVKSDRVDKDDERLWVKPATYLEDWNKIEEMVMSLEYELEDGSGFMSIKTTYCDMGGYARDKSETVTENAYKYWRKLRKDGKSSRFQLLKGDPNHSAPRAALEYPDTKQKDRTVGARGEIPVLFFNVNVLKDSLNGLLENTTEGQGRILYADWLEDYFFRELCAERRTPKGWEKVSSNARNEAWDLLTYCLGTLAFLRMEHWDWAKPPGWAEEWAKNSLVRKPAAPKPFEQKATSGKVSKYAELLG